MIGERLPDWRPKLERFLEEAQARPLVWGQWDCVVGLAAGAVEALTGTDLAKDWRGRYRDHTEAVRLARLCGGLDLLVSNALGHASISPASARRGDLVVRETPHGDALGVLIGPEAVFLADRSPGLVREPRQSCRAAWPVGWEIA